MTKLMGHTRFVIGTLENADHLEKTWHSAAQVSSAVLTSVRYRQVCQHVPMAPIVNTSCSDRDELDLQLRNRIHYGTVRS